MSKTTSLDARALLYHLWLPIELLFHNFAIEPIYLNEAIDLFEEWRVLHLVMDVRLEFRGVGYLHATD
jgi:hypothetical protein